MPQNAQATATTAVQSFPPGTQLGGNYRFRAISGVPVTTTILSATPTALFTGLAAGTYTFDAVRMGVDTTTPLGTLRSQSGIVITADTLVTVVASLSVSVVQV